MTESTNTSQGKTSPLSPEQLSPGWVKEDMTAAALPEYMAVADDFRGPYRVPLCQFAADWNHSDNPAALIAEAPVYDGDDAVLLPAVAVVVHSFCDRDGVDVPNWVWHHRSEKEVHLFGFSLDTPTGQWERSVSPPACEYHRVFFEPSLLDKGSPRQWEMMKQWHLENAC